MIQELLARAAEDLTVALNNFETARKELTDDELAAFKEVCRKAKEAVQEALEAAKGDLDAKTADTIRKIETLIRQGLTSIDEKVSQADTDITGKVDKAKQDVDIKVRQGLTSVDEKVAHAGTDITGKVDKAKQDVDTKVQQGLTSIAEKTAQGVAAVDTKEQEAKQSIQNLLNKPALSPAGGVTVENAGWKGSLRPCSNGVEFALEQNGVKKFYTKIDNASVDLYIKGSIHVENTIERWTRRNSPQTSWLYSVYYANDTWVAVGDKDILTSGTTVL